MQLSTNELIKMLAETAKQTEETVLAKMKQDEKPKQMVYKVAVTYNYHDMEKDIDIYSYNSIMTKKPSTAIQDVINDLTLKLTSDNIKIEYNPVTLTYDLYKRTNADGQICVARILNIRECIIERVEI